MMNEKKKKKIINDESLDQVTGGRLGGGGNEKVPYFHCNAEGCGHRWIPQQAGHITRCPKCGSPDITKE